MFRDISNLFLFSTMYSLLGLFPLSLGLHYMAHFFINLRANPVDCRVIIRSLKLKALIQIGFLLVYDCIYRSFFFSFSCYSCHFLSLFINLSYIYICAGYIKATLIVEHIHWFVQTFDSAFCSTADAFASLPTILIIFSTTGYSLYPITTVSDGSQKTPITFQCLTYRLHLSFKEMAQNFGVINFLNKTNTLKTSVTITFGFGMAQPSTAFERYCLPNFIHRPSFNMCCGLHTLLDAAVRAGIASSG